MENNRQYYQSDERGYFQKSKDYINNWLLTIYSFICLFFSTMFISGAGSNNNRSSSSFSRRQGGDNSNSPGSGFSSNCFRFRGMGGG